MVEEYRKIKCNLRLHEQSEAVVEISILNWCGCFFILVWLLLIQIAACFQRLFNVASMFLDNKNLDDGISFKCCIVVEFEIQVSFIVSQYIIVAFQTFVGVVESTSNRNSYTIWTSWLRQTNQNKFVCLFIDFMFFLFIVTVCRPI